MKDQPYLYVHVIRWQIQAAFCFTYFQETCCKIIYPPLVYTSAYLIYCSVFD